MLLANKVMVSAPLLPDSEYQVAKIIEESGEYSSALSKTLNRTRYEINQVGKITKTLR